MEQVIINNVFLKVEVDTFLKTQNQTQDTFIKLCISKDLCVGLITKIKCNPYYFNETGKKLTYLFLDIDTKKVSPISKNGKTLYRNCKENKIDM